jgi:hypothetical protein
MDDKEIYYGYGLIFENPSLRFAPDYLEHDNLWFGDEIKAVSNWGYPPYLLGYHLDFVT